MTPIKSDQEYNYILDHLSTVRPGDRRDYIYKILMYRRANKMFKILEPVEYDTKIYKVVSTLDQDNRIWLRDSDLIRYICVDADDVKILSFTQVSWYSLQME